MVDELRYYYIIVKIEGVLSMKRNLTEIIFLLDRSGPMGGLETDTIKGFNSFIERQTQLEGETIVTTVLFDDEYEILWNGISSNKVKLTDKEYYVRGSTALLDALGNTILSVGHRLSQTSEDERADKIIFVITTDGMENSSCEFNYEKIKELIKQHQEKYNWEFIFLGANIDVKKEAVRIGIDMNNSYSFEDSEAGVENMYHTVCEAVFSKRQSSKESR